MVDIYLSIAVIPGREDKLERCLKTIMKQEVMPKKIFISVCTNYKRFPDKQYNRELYLNKYLENDLFELLETDVDYGPATKLIMPLLKLQKLENKNNVFILSADDDNEYQTYFIKTFTNCANQNKPKMIWTGYAEQRGKPMTTAFGADGILLPLNTLDNYMKYYDIVTKDNSEWFFHDDFIVSTYYYFKKYEIRKTQHLSKIVNEKWDEHSLTQRLAENHDTGRNRQLGILIGSYNKLLPVFEKENI